LGVVGFLFGEIWLGFGMAMLVPDCIVLFMASIAFIENATVATEIGCFSAFFTNLLGSKYQMYAKTYRGVGWLCVLVRLALL
jgi:hypothetical protein